MTEISDGIRILDGTTDIVVVAPHGPLIDGKFENDVRTSIIGEEIHRLLGCFTIINDRFFKPKGPVKKDAKQYFLDLYRVDHSAKVAGYMEAIRHVADSDKKSLVLWLHGIFDQFAIDRAKEHMELGLYEGPPENLQALIAYGQGGDPKTGVTRDSLSARQATVDRFSAMLNKSGIQTILTHPHCNNYRGRDAKRFNQWFINNGYNHDQVESIQLELKESGLRDTKENAVQTARLLASILMALN
ncbi:MAG: hypothetical protein ABFS19_01145 [Thermodesulfobacteriota bacterium]